MQEKKDKQTIWVKLKEDKGARAIAITVTVMLLVLTAIIIATVIANRAQEEEPPEGNLPSEPAVVEPQDEGKKPGAGQSTPQQPSQPGTTDKDTDKKEDVLPSHFLLPVSGVLTKSHDASHQVFSDTMGDYRVHLGIDIGTVAGASVAAMADGVIAQVWEDVKMGQCVAVRHGGDAYTIYKNLSPELPETTAVGRTVKAGDVLGTVGESAMVEIAEEPHLHLEMTVGGLQVDPTEYLDADALASLHEDTNYEDVS